MSKTSCRKVGGLTSRPRWGDTLGQATVGNVTDAASKNHAGELSRIGLAMPEWTRKNVIGAPRVEADKDWANRSRTWKGSAFHD